MVLELGKGYMLSYDLLCARLPASSVHKRVKKALPFIYNSYKKNIVPNKSRQKVMVNTNPIQVIATGLSSIFS